MIIRRTTPSEHRPFQQLLTAEYLGDQRPTQPLHHTQQLLGDRHATFNQSLLRELFLQRLPSHVRMILAANTELALPAAVDLADHLMDIITPTVAVVSPPPKHVKHLQSEMADLKKLVPELHAVQHQLCPPSRTPCAGTKRSTVPYTSIHFYLP